MRANAELHPEAVWFLTHSCSESDVIDFQDQFEYVCHDPIGRSQMFNDPGVSRYVERWFAFGTGVEKIAIFSYDGNVVKVLRCRMSQPRRRRSAGKRGNGRPGQAGSP